MHHVLNHSKSMLPEVSSVRQSERKLDNVRIKLKLTRLSRRSVPLNLARRTLVQQPCPTDPQ